MPFSPEEEPDGAVDAPHHLYLGVIIQGIGGAFTWFFFQYVWPYYPRVGAAGTLAAVGLSGLGVLVALDDVVEHSMPVPTPLDELWVRVIYPIVRRIER
ncbi:hypothetical protein GWK26_12715 [haloarchaeon 3A1-DGR]|nr:hypothetical protein GWK26_12715 [haloarchaeon 3A1-DGR]